MMRRCIFWDFVSILRYPEVEDHYDRLKGLEGKGVASWLLFRVIERGYLSYTSNMRKIDTANSTKTNLLWLNACQKAKKITQNKQLTEAFIVLFKVAICC